MIDVDPTAPEPTAPADGVDIATWRLLDELAANGTAAPVTRIIDGWLCKSAPELPFRRANAVMPVSGAGADPSDTARTLAAVEAWYQSLGRRLLVQVPATESGLALDEILARRGLTVEAPVDILVADAEAVAELGSRSGDARRLWGEAAAIVAVRKEHSGATEGALAAERKDYPGATEVGQCKNAGRPDGEVGGRTRSNRLAVATATSEARSGAEPPLDGLTLHVHSGIAEPGMPRSGTIQGGDQLWVSRNEAYRRMLAPLGHDVVAATVSTLGYADAQPDVAAVGFAVLERGWAGIYGMAIAEAWRRRGLGGALLGALAIKARSRSAHRLYLQVEVDNVAAQALYRGLGFTRSHGYHYRVSATA